MKFINILLLVIFTISIGITSCKKYEEGPGLSFRSKKQRIANTWKYENYILNGVELAGNPQYQTTKVFMSANGEMNTTFINNITGIASSVNGNWELLDNDTKISIKQNNVIQGLPETTTLYNILKLQNDEMWLRSGDLTTDIHFVPSK